MAKGIVKVRGSGRSAAAVGGYHARGLRWQELPVARARIEGDIKSTDQIAWAISTFCVERISQPDVNINLVTLDAKGSEQHRYSSVFRGTGIRSTS